MDIISELNRQSLQELGVHRSRLSKKRVKIGKKIVFSKFPDLRNESNVEFKTTSLPKVVKVLPESRYFMNNNHKINESEVSKAEIEKLRQKLLEKEIEIKALKNLYFEAHQELKREKSLNSFEVKYSSPKQVYKEENVKTVSFDLPGRKFSVPGRPDSLDRYTSLKLLPSIRPKKIKPIIKAFKLVS